MVRLDKFLADAGFGTRSEVKNMIRKGKVYVNGNVMRGGDYKVNAEADRILVNGVEVSAPPEFVYYLLNKPAGVVSATEDKKEKTVLSLVPQDARRNLFPVGRLDKDTEGLLLITDDGPLAHDLLAPGKHVDKTYFVRVNDSISREMLLPLKEGVDIGDEKKTLPASFEILSETELLLTIHEGRFHQVKRMMESVGRKVVYLKRISMGKLTLPEKLQTGEYVEIKKKDIY